MFSLEPGARPTACRNGFCKNPPKCRYRLELTYDISDPLGGQGRTGQGVGGAVPDLRRFSGRAMCAMPSHAFGVPYWCRSSASTDPRRGAGLREAYPVAERFLRALRVAAPARAPHRISRRDRPSGRRRVRPISAIARAATSSPTAVSQTRRSRRLHCLFANPLSAGESPGLRQLAIVRKAQTRRAGRLLSLAG